jgi:Tetratricopeptide repeat/Surface antigen variable number repeat
VTALVLAAALLLAGDAPLSYDQLVSRAVAAGHEGRLDEAARDLDAAIAQDGSRPEARVERGGLLFLEKRYDDAARELRTALRLHDDPYARDLLASSLYLAGQEDEALAEWNVLGKPTVSQIEISGLVHVLDKVARREVVPTEGGVLTLRSLRQTRLRLREVGVFDRVTVRVTPQPDGKAQLDVALLERHGLFSSPVEALVASGTNALNHLARLRYSDLAGEGLSVGALYRWEKNRPKVAISLEWPRPLDLDANLHFSAFNGRQRFDVPGGGLLARVRGFDLGARRVVGPGTVVDLAVRARRRVLSRSDPLDDVGASGTSLGGALGVEHRLLDGRRHRLDLSGELLLSGSEARYTRFVLGASDSVSLSSPDGSLIDRSVLVSRILWGRSSDETPIDERFAAGGSAEMDFPLRAHAQVSNGTLGSNVPVSRSMVLGNLEWRRRLLRRSLVQVGLVAFCDAATLAGTVGGDLDHNFLDVGMGIRVGVGGGSIVRFDWGHGLSDGQNAIFIGLGQVF